MRYPLMSFVIIHLCIISLIAIFVTVSDKIKAKRGKWRIPESVLLAISAMGGSFAMYTAMKLIRHKTNHRRFMLGIPIMMLFHVILLLWLLHFSGIF